MAFEFIRGEHNELAVHCLNSSANSCSVSVTCMVLIVVIIAFKNVR